MITLFRRIRERLVASGSITKYLVYAVGEILLVVIGILIALQVNNWNEKANNSEIETVYLSELLEDFEINLMNANQQIENLEDALPDILLLLEQSALKIPDVPVDSLNEWFTVMQRMPTFKSTDRAYLNITGNGELKLIQSRQVKNSIAQYYSSLDVLKIVQNTHELQLVETFQPYIIDNLSFQAVYLKRVNDFPLPPPVDKDVILNVLQSQKFRNVLISKWTIMTDLLNQKRMIKEDIRAVIASIKEDGY